MGQLFYISELSMYQHKLAQRMDGVLIKAPFCCLISRIGLTKYYRFCFFVNMSFTCMMLTSRISAIYTGIPDYGTVVVVSILYIWNISFQFVSLNNFKSLVKKFSAEMRKLQIALFFITILKMVLDITTSVFESQLSVCATCFTGGIAAVAGIAVRIVSRLSVMGILLVVLSIHKQIVVIMQKFKLSTAGSVVV